MKEKNKFILTLLSAVFLMILWVVFLFVPYYRTTVETENLTKSYEDNYKKISVLTERIEERRQQGEQIGAELARMKEEILSETDIDHLLGLMRKKLDNYGIKILSLQPDLEALAVGDGNTADSAYYHLPVVMSLEAGFENLVEFLDDLERLPYYLQPEGYQISRANDFSQRLSIRIYLNLLIKRSNV